MNLYLLEPKGINPGYDANHGFVIAASSVNAARSMAQAEIATEKSIARDFWQSIRYSSCTMIGTTTKYRRSTVVLVSFNAA